MLILLMDLPSRRYVLLAFYFHLILWAFKCMQECTTYRTRSQAGLNLTVPNLNTIFCNVPDGKRNKEVSWVKMTCGVQLTGHLSIEHKYSGAVEGSLDFSRETPPQ